MSTKFTDQISLIADEIIALSLHLDNEIETWNDVFVRVPDSTSIGVSAGFISKPVKDSNIEMVIDVQAPPTEQAARLRIWAIETTKDASGNERFNNIQLTYSLDCDMARTLVEQPESVTRSSLSTLAHTSANNLDSIIISDFTGKDEATGQTLGKRYDLGLDELSNMVESQCDELLSVMDSVLGRLKESTDSI